MNTSFKTIALFGISILLSAFTFAGTPKTLQPIEKQKSSFNIERFTNYLENGVPHKLEGVYASPDNRYKIAIVKNNALHHDFIGIVISADNKYWETGDVKFNFIMGEEALKGYYYNNSGEEFPIEFNIVAESIETNYLHKIQ